MVGASNWTWGGNFTGSTDANIDELNIVPATRSDGWIATEYNNRHDPSTFYGLSSATPADASAPINPASYSGYSDSAKATTLTTSQWYSYASPYFEWSAATDPETDIEGYWVYFGTDPSATPSVSGSFQVATNYTASSMTSGNTYYLRLQSQNVADVVSTAETFFTYKYDSTSPSAPDYVNISPVGCSINTSFTFTWPAGVDTGGSDIAGYDYRRGSTGTIQQTTELTATTTSYQEGENIFYVRSRDNAGNTSAWQTAVYCSTATAQIADGPTITAGPSSILVNWNSSKATTGYVKVYDGNTYISEQGHTEYTLTHSVRVVGLEPEKAYRYQLIWSDSSGNLGSADWYSTTTATAPAVKNLEVTIISPTSASVTWSTTQEASSALEYGVGSYSNSEDLSGYGTTFSKTFSGLTSGNIYQIRIKGTTTGDSTKFFAAKDFTMPPLPEISSLSYEMIDSGSTVGAKVSWKTNTDTTTSLFYGQKGSNFKEVATTDKVRDHSAEVSGLSDSSVYDFYVAGADAYGNTAKSSTLSFSTPADRRPPTISEIITETSNVGLNKQDKAQIVISWKTDEQSTSYVEYDTGLSGSEYKQKSAEDKNLTNSHIVILSDLTPSQPYHLRVSSADKGNNIAKSEDITIIAGDVPKSIFNIITNTFENVFGWLGKLI